MGSVFLGYYYMYWFVEERRLLSKLINNLTHHIFSSILYVLLHLISLFSFSWLSYNTINTPIIFTYIFGQYFLKLYKLLLTRDAYFGYFEKPELVLESVLVRSMKNRFWKNRFGFKTLFFAKNYNLCNRFQFLKKRFFP